MAILKYKLSDGWKILYSEFFQKVVYICRQALLKNKNLSDLDDIAAARQNLELDSHYLRQDRNLSDVRDAAATRANIGLVNEVTTHWHDTRYPKISELDKYVKKAGDTMTGPINVSGIDTIICKDVKNEYVEIMGGPNEQSGAHLSLYGSNHATKGGQVSLEANNGTNYCRFTIDPVNGVNISKNEVVNGTFKTSGGFVPDIVDTPQLNDYHQKLNFIYGSHPAGTNNHLTPFFGSDGCDYGGIVFGSPLNTTQGSWGGAIAQLVFNGGTRLLFRGRDSYSDENWGAWQSIANMNDINSVKSSITSLQSSVNSSISSLTTKVNNATSDVLKAVKDQTKIQANGYITFSNGLTIQWGKKLFNTNTVNSTVNFNQPFSEVYAVVANGQRSTSGSIGGTYTYHMLSAQPTRSGFSIKSAIESGSGSQYIHWIALGKLMNPSQIAESVTVTFSKSGSPDFNVTYTSNLSESLTTNNPSSVSIKKGSTIKITNTKKNYHIVIKQGSTQKANLAYNGTWTSGAISAATTFTLSTSYDYENSGGGGE